MKVSWFFSHILLQAIFNFLQSINKLTMEARQEKSSDSDEKGNEFSNVDKMEGSSQKPTPEVDETTSDSQATVSELFS